MFYNINFIHKIIYVKNIIKNMVIKSVMENLNGVRSSSEGWWHSVEEVVWHVDKKREGDK